MKFSMLLAGVLCLSTTCFAEDSARPFGDDYPQLDSLAVGEWWTWSQAGRNGPPNLDEPRGQVVAFAVHTHENRVLKMSA